MKLHFTLRFGGEQSSIVVAGGSVITSDKIEGDLVQRMIDVERFLELVLQREVNFEVKMLPPGSTKVFEAPQVSITKMDQLLDQERQSRNERCQKCNGLGTRFNELQRRMETCGMCGGRGLIVR